MKAAHDFDLVEASRVLGVANTPLFLVRKLQADAEIRAISEEVSGEQILEGLAMALSQEPATPVEAVRPYAYLVALWFKPVPVYLKDAAKLSPAAEHWRWFEYISSVLIETYSHVESATLKVPVLIAEPVKVSPAPTTATGIIITG